MCELPATKDHRYLDLMACFEKLQRVSKFELEVMLVDSRAHPDALDLGHPLLLLGLALTLPLLILILAVVHYPADRRIGGRSNLDEIQALTLRVIKGFPERHNTHLGAVLIYQPHFPRTYALIYPKVLYYNYITSKLSGLRHAHTRYRQTVLSIAKILYLCQLLFELAY